MTVREYVEIGIATVVVLGGVVDLGAYLSHGYHATLTSIVRDWIARYPGTLLFVGMLVDHLFLK